MNRWSLLSARIVPAVFGILVLIAVSLVPAATPAYAAGTPADHPYSDPIFLPLRTPAKVGCTRTACDNGPAHGFWGIDFIGNRGDGIYAAGAGIAHIGGTSGDCSKSDESERGRWVWVDHGAGVVTHYRHLDSITITEGEWVTPHTRVGTMGGSGSAQPYCNNAYLHFEVRNGGNTGTPVDPGQLISCTTNGPVSLPALWGASSWDDPQAHPRPRLATPTGTSDCVDEPWLKTPDAPTTSVTRGDRAAGVTWAAPAQELDSLTVVRETWHPTLNAWGSPVYRPLDAAVKGTVFTDMINGKTYRVSVSVHGEAGHSRPSSWRQVVPAGLPAAPESPRFLTWPKTDYVHYGWHRPFINGSPVTTFTSARRCRVGSGPYDAWKKYTQAADAVYINFRGLTTYTTCQVKVRATNGVGTGPYSQTSTITRPVS